MDLRFSITVSAITEGVVAFRLGFDAAVEEVGFEDAARLALDSLRSVKSSSSTDSAGSGHFLPLLFLNQVVSFQAILCFEGHIKRFFHFYSAPPLLTTEHCSSWTWCCWGNQFALRSPGSAV